MVFSDLLKDPYEKFTSEMIAPAQCVSFWCEVQLHFPVPVSSLFGEQGH